MRPVGVKLWMSLRISVERTFLSHRDQCAAAKGADVGTLKEASYMQTLHCALDAESVLEMEKKGTEGYIELGPGSVLSGLIRKISKSKRPYPVSTRRAEAALEFLRGGI